MKKCILDMTEQELREEYRRHCEAMEAGIDDDPIVDLPTTLERVIPFAEEDIPAVPEHPLAGLAYGEVC